MAETREVLKTELLSNMNVSGSSKSRNFIAALMHMQKHDEFINAKVMYKHTKDKENYFIWYLRSINSLES